MFAFTLHIKHCNNMQRNYWLDNWQSRNNQCVLTILLSERYCKAGYVGGGGGRRGVRQ